jgi:hypothetical protein
MIAFPFYDYVMTRETLFEKRFSLVLSLQKLFPPKRIFMRFEIGFLRRCGTLLFPEKKVPKPLS